MSRERNTPNEIFSLPVEYSWIIFQILERKAHTAIPLYLSSIDGSRDPFFTTFGVIKNNEQLFRVEWDSLDLDAAIFLQFLEYCKRVPTAQYSHAEVDAVANLLCSSPLFAALDSTSIIPSAEHCTNAGVPITPLQHIKDVATALPDTPVLHSVDAHVARILPWVHDIGKMAAVAYLPQDASHRPEMQRYMKEAFNRKSSHTYPAHAEVGTVILLELLQKLHKSYSQPFSEDELQLLCAVVFHHHHFIYPHDTPNLEERLSADIQNHLIPTLPSDRPDLVVRFFALLLQFRYADVLSSPAHHKHWPANVEWYSQLPDILKNNILVNSSKSPWMPYLEDVITSLPREIVDLSGV